MHRSAIKRVSRDANQSAAADGAGGSKKAASRRALKNWRVRARLFLLVIIPTVTATAAGGIFIASSLESASVSQRVQTMANLSGTITGLVQALQNEREDTVQFIVLGNGNGGRGAALSSAAPPGPELGLLGQDYAATNGWAHQVKAMAGKIDGSYSALAQQDVQAAVIAIGNLPAIRAAATGTQLPALIVIDEYATGIGSLLAVESQIAVGSSDSTLAGSVRVLGLVSGMKEEAAQQQALLTSALRSDLVGLGRFGPAQQSAITDAQAQQQGDLNEFGTAATAAQRQLLNDVLSSPNVVQAQAQEQQAISLASSKSPIGVDPAIPEASSALSFVVGGLRSAEQQLANSVISRSGSVYHSAITSAVSFGVAVALLLGIALTTTIIIGRSMEKPLRRLRNGALQVAEDQLPELVRRMSEIDWERTPAVVEPIDVDSSDEIGQVARAFDQVHREAVRLAGNEAMLRGNVSAMFISLSRRSVPLIGRLARMIDTLEQNEDDPDRLSNLFSMDHLVTRMRRNSENLLVLAGEEPVRKWSEPVPLADVIRAATSEIEQYNRVLFSVQPGIVVSGQAVADVVHLLAEIIENATTFSPGDTSVEISGHGLTSGGVLLEVKDTGVGIPASRLAEINWRLDNPPVVDVAVSQHMGLFAASRLAARHGVRIRLQPAAPQGLSALVWLPGNITSRDTVPQAGGQRPSRRQPRVVSGGQRSAPGARSNWFRAKRPSGRDGADGRVPIADGQDVPAAPNWNAFGGAAQSAAAHPARTPVRGDRTVAGLPLRVPGVNLIPGSIRGNTADGPATDDIPPASERSMTEQVMARRRTSLPQRSPELARNRLGGFQLGSREAETPSAGEGASR